MTIDNSGNIIVNEQLYLNFFLQVLREKSNL